MGKEKGENDILSDFFGDDDIDWDDDTGERPLSEAAQATAPPPTSESEPEVSAVQGDTPVDPGNASAGVAPEAHRPGVSSSSPPDPADLALQAAREGSDEEPTAQDTPPPAEPAKAQVAVPVARVSVGKSPAMSAPESAPISPLVVRVEQATSKPASSAPPLLSVIPPDPALLTLWHPRGDEDAWRAMADDLVAEAECVELADAADLLFEASRIRRIREHDQSGSEVLAFRAQRAGCESPELLRALTESAIQQRDMQGAVEFVLSRAGVSAKVPSSESYEEAAQLAEHHLKDANKARRYRRLAVEADPQNFAALSAVHDDLAGTGSLEERYQVLEQMTALSTGPTAAQLYWEQGRVAQQLGRDKDARRCFEQGLAQDSTHTPCWLSLEAGYFALNDTEGLADLYWREASRPDQPEPGWWWLEAARAARASGRTEQAQHAFDHAVAAGHPFARRERQAWQLAGERWSELAACLTEEAERTHRPQAKAFVLYQLGQIQADHLGDIQGALASYRTVLRLDPKAYPAAEAIAHWLFQQGDYEALHDFWSDRLIDCDHDQEVTSLLLRLGHLCEVHLTDDDRAANHYQHMVQDRGPGYRVALESLTRVYRRQENGSALADTHEALATLIEQPAVQAAHWTQAALLWKHVLHNPERALENFERAMQKNKENTYAFSEYLELLESLGRTQALTQALDLAIEAASPGIDKAILYYQAGKHHADTLGDLEGALACFQACLEAQPDFFPVRGPLLTVCRTLGRTDVWVKVCRQQAASCEDPGIRNWWYYAAACWADPTDHQDAKSILDFDPSHLGALALQEWRLLNTHDELELLGLYRNALQGLSEDTYRCYVLARIAQLHAVVANTSQVSKPLREVLSLAVPGRPLRSLARLAESCLLYKEAQGFLEPLSSSYDCLERARILAVHLNRRREALSLVSGLLADPEWGERAALQLVPLAQTLGVDDRLRQAHAKLAMVAEHPSIQAAHALWAAQGYESAGDREQALHYYQHALNARPTSERAFEGARRQLLAFVDAEGLKELFQQAQPENTWGLAHTLEVVEDREGVANAWRDGLSAQGDTLAGLMYLEMAEAKLGQWIGVYRALERRHALTKDPAACDRVRAKIRWILSEKLVDSDTAWKLHLVRHAEDPGDRELTRLLVRTAFARKETEVAIQCLKDLIETSESDEESASLWCQLGEVYLQEERLEDARTIYQQVLDEHPGDSRAIQGLHLCFEAEQDWQGLVGSLQKQASALEGEARIAAYRHIADVATNLLGDPTLAAESWRTVLVHAPKDRQALSALYNLHLANDAWDYVVLVGEQLIQQAQGAERARLAREVGLVLLDKLNRIDGVALLEQAVACDAPDQEAAVRLEAIGREVGDWAQVMHALVAQATISADPDEQVAHLAQAATIEVEQRDRLAEASNLYQQVLQRDPEHQQALRFQANYLYERARYDEALPLFERLIQLLAADTPGAEPTALRAPLIRLSELFARAHRTDEALQALDRALELDPSNQQVLEALGDLLVATQAWSRARSIYDQLIALVDDHTEAWANAVAQRSRVLIALGELDTAQETLREALKDQPTQVTLLKVLALILSEKKAWSELLTIYNTIIYHATTVQEVTHAYLAKGIVLDEHLDRPNKAKEHYEHSLRVNPHQPVVLLRLAELGLRSKDWPRARQMTQRALQLASAPDALRANLLLCWAAAEMGAGDPERAQAAIVEARACDPRLTQVLGDDPHEQLPEFCAQIRRRVSDAS